MTSTDQPPPGPVLEARDLRKSYGPRHALHGLSFSLDAGRILGFLGPNGAGKTTAIRILTTILEADSGSFRVVGIDSTRPAEIRRRIGVLPESMGFPKSTSAVDYLSFYARMYGRDRHDARAVARDLLSEVGLAGRASSAIGGYSRGMRQRIGIARALVNDPAVLFLDEPTLGLDPRGQQELLELIPRVAGERSVAVVLCSHALSEVESVCDDAVILNRGNVAASGTVASVIGGSDHLEPRPGRRIQVHPSDVDAAESVLAGVGSVIARRDGSGWIGVILDGGGGLTNNALLTRLIDEGIDVLGFETAGRRLEDVFLQLTEETSA